MKIHMIRKIVLAGALALASPWACSEKLGDWFLSTYENGVPPRLGVRNVNNDVLVQSCDAEEMTCVYQLRTRSISCDQKIPAILSVDDGATPVGLHCAGFVNTTGGVYYVYTIAPFKTVEEHLKNTSSVGIAMPLQGRKFMVFRFDTKGSGEASKKMNHEKLRWRLDKKKGRS